MHGGPCHFRFPLALASRAEGVLGRLTALGRHTAANVRPSASSRAVSLVKDLPALDRHIDVLPPSSMAWQTRPVIPAA